MMNNRQAEQTQLSICQRHGVEHVASLPSLKVGISSNVRDGILPINGLRHPPEGDTTGWYIWAGEGSPDDNDDAFFLPLHVDHLEAWCPQVIPYLGLPPG